MEDDKNTASADDFDELADEAWDFAFSDWSASLKGSLSVFCLPSRWDL